MFHSKPDPIIEEFRLQTENTQTTKTKQNSGIWNATGEAAIFFFKPFRIVTFLCFKKMHFHMQRHCFGLHYEGIQEKQTDQKNKPTPQTEFFSLNFMLRIVQKTFCSVWAK